MSRSDAETADACVAIIAAMIGATGLSRAEFMRKTDEYAHRYGDDPEGGRRFAAEMEGLAEARRRN